MYIFNVCGSEANCLSSFLPVSLVLLVHFDGRGQSEHALTPVGGHLQVRRRKWLGLHGRKVSPKLRGKMKWCNLRGERIDNQLHRDHAEKGRGPAQKTLMTKSGRLTESVEAISNDHDQILVIEGRQGKGMTLSQSQSQSQRKKQGEIRKRRERNGPVH